MKNQSDQHRHWLEEKQGFCRQEEQQQQTLATVAAGVAIAGTVGGVALEASQAAKAGHTAGTIPQWNGNFTPVTAPSYNPTQGINDVGAMLYGGTGAGSTAVGLANQLTQRGINQRNKIMPGASAQLAQGSADINSYLRGQIPQDVINQTQRAVAASTGGGYNALSGGGQSPDAFARSIGQTSLGIQQMGLSAAPTWQSLANSFVVNPVQIAGLAQNASSQRYNYDALNVNTQIANQQGQLAEATGKYQAGINSYQAQNIAQQQQVSAGNQEASMLMGAANTATSLYGGINNANYLNRLPAYSNSMSLPSQSQANTALGFTPQMATSSVPYNN